VSARCVSCRKPITAGAPFCRNCGAPQLPPVVDDAVARDGAPLLPLESEPPPSLPENSWHGVRRLLVLYALMLGCSALFALLLGLKVARQSELDAFISGCSALLVVAFSLHERRLLAPLLNLRNLRLGGAARIALGVVVTVVVLELYFFLLSSFGIPTYRSWPSFEDDGWSVWSAFVLVAVMPGIFEELAFRGLIYQGLCRVMTRRDALLVQAMAFSVLHLSPWIFLSHFLMGLSLGLLRDATKSLYPGMLAHACWNAWIIADEAGLV
jgi:membrane protease YdiL (CAAX protease family)